MQWKAFILRIVLPTLIAIILFIFTIFKIMIPAFQKNIMDRKREMIRELTHTAWSILEQYHRLAEEGKIDMEKAKKEALSRIRDLRYGDERKDYFWINDLHPRMVMHPYLSELNNTDLTHYEDARKKKLFQEVVKIVSEKNEGFVEYMWQWKDNHELIVPKLSFVKIFHPWKWVVGTGIYLEDVKHEIEKITYNLMKTSIIVIILIVIILFFVSKQSLKIEKEKAKISQALLESKEKYQALVEASTEGTLMILNNQITYANKPLLNLLGYDFEELKGLEWKQLFYHPENNFGMQTFYDLINNKKVANPFEAELITKQNKPINFLITHSPIQIQEEKGFILILKDITIYDAMEDELGKTKQKYFTLINHINLGVFRIEAEGKRRVIEANPYFMQFFSLLSDADLKDFQFSSLFFNREDYFSLFSQGLEQKIVRNKEVKILKKDGTIATVLISLVLIENEEHTPLYFDGILEDITLKKREDYQKENLIQELQASLSFLYLPVKNCAQKIQSIGYQESIKKTADWMTRNKLPVCLVHDNQHHYIGMVMEKDFKERVVSVGLEGTRPIYEIMSAPIFSVDENAMIFEVLYILNEKSMDCVVCKNTEGNFTGILTLSDLMRVQQYSSSLIIKEIANASSIERMKEIFQKIDFYIKALVETGVNARNVNHILSHISDLITKKVIDYVIEEIGTPPVAFSFLALGSEGREEQTLNTDQDNAIVYENVPDDKKEEVKAYFETMGAKICDYLHEIGYQHCKGNVMAKNPKWCQSLSVWINYFNHWVYHVSQDNLLEINTFFDFRLVYGEKSLVEKLKKHQLHLIEKVPSILVFLAQVTSNIKLPLNFRGNLSADSKGKNPELIDIKLIMLPIINFARVYALKYGIEETNTLDRLEKIYQNKAIPKSLYEELTQAYDYLMQLRIKNQVSLLNMQKEPSNLIHPKKITNIQKTTLEKILLQIENMQSFIHNDFIKT